MGFSCLYSGICSGCDLLHFSRHQIEMNRAQELEAYGLPVHELGERFKTVWIEDGGLRDRVELVVERTQPSGRLRCGLYARTESTELRHAKLLLEITGCSQFSPALEQFYQEFIGDLPLVSRRGSVRLRTGPHSERGLWLDFSNEDIRDLLFEENWISRALERGWIIEMGQRRKRVVAGAGLRRFKLDEPVLEPWFQTWCNDQAFNLFGTIGTFTQPGLLANRKLVQTVVELILKSKTVTSTATRTAVEFGCGIGNFTLPLASIFHKVSVFETDRLALEGLKRGLTAAKLEAGVEIRHGDFIRGAHNMEIGTPELILVDPPRSGLGNFLTILQNPAARQAKWIYISCFPESLGRDLQTLFKAGLRLDSVSVVEQFPFTRHYEVIVSLKSSTQA